MSDQVSTHIAPQTVQTTASKTPPTTQPLRATITQPIKITKLQSVTRPITLNAEALNLTPSGQMTLQTKMGPINIQLATSTGDFFQALNHLIATNFKDAQKPLFELLIQAGTPPKEATLFVTGKDKNLFIQKPKTEQPIGLEKKGEVSLFTKGQTITITPLPKDVATKNILQPQSKIADVAQKLIIENSPQIKNALPEVLSKAATLVKDKSVSFLQQIDPRALPNKEKNTQQLQNNNTVSQRATNTELTAQPARIQINHIIPAGKESLLPLQDNQIKAEIIGKSLSGQTILKNKSNTFLVENKGSLPTGTKIVGTPLPLTQHHNIPIRSSHEHAVHNVMEELVTNLHQASPQVAQNFTQHIPSPQQNMTGSLLFLLNAIQGNKIEDWVGQTRLATLGLSLRKKTTDSLSQTFQEKSITATDNNTTEWRSWNIPLLNEGVMDSLRFYVRQDQNKDSKNKKLQDTPLYTRFVISLSASQLGHMQIDGLSQPKKLDIILRSEKKLPKDLINELRQASHKIYEATGLTGSIHFQEHGNNWVHFNEEKTESVNV